MGQGGAGIVVPCPQRPAVPRLPALLWPCASARGGRIERRTRELLRDAHLLAEESAEHLSYLLLRAPEELRRALWPHRPCVALQDRECRGELGDGDDAVEVGVEEVEERCREDVVKGRLRDAQGPPDHLQELLLAQAALRKVLRELLSYTTSAG